MRNLSPFLISVLVVLGAIILVPRLRAEEVSHAGANVPAPAATFVYSREQLLADLNHELATHFSTEGELQLELQRPWLNPAPSASAWTLTVLEFPAQIATSVLVRVRLETAANKPMELTLPLHLQLWRDAYVSREPLVRDGEFDTGSLDVRRVDSLQEHDAVYGGTVNGSYTFSRPVPAGRLLAWRDLAKRSLVRKGDVVEVQAVDGFLTVTMKALAMQSGANGEMVTVRNIETRRDIHARIIGERLVEVRF